MIPSLRALFERGRAVDLYSIRLGMAKTTTSISSGLRSRVVKRLTAMVGISVVLQAVIFLALSWGYRLIAQLLVETAARMSGGRPSAAGEGVAAAIVVALDLFTALAVGFFGARRLLRFIVRATPHPMKPPTRPIPWAALSAAGLVAAISMLAFASHVQPLGTLWFGWTFELLRDAAIVALFWFAAVRAVRPRTR
jgi:hypothetical protein